MPGKYNATITRKKIIKLNPRNVLFILRTSCTEIYFYEMFLIIFLRAYTIHRNVFLKKVHENLFLFNMTSR